MTTCDGAYQERKKVRVAQQRIRGATRDDGTGASGLESSITAFSRLPRLIAVYDDENDEYFALGMSPLM